MRNTLRASSSGLGSSLTILDDTVIGRVGVETAVETSCSEPSEVDTAAGGCGVKTSQEVVDVDEALVEMESERSGERSACEYEFHMAFGSRRINGAATVRDSWEHTRTHLISRSRHIS